MTSESTGEFDYTRRDVTIAPSYLKFQLQSELQNARILRATNNAERSRSQRPPRLAIVRMIHEIERFPAELKIEPLLKPEVP